MSQEDQELIELYGNRIRVIRWCFENDQTVKLSKKRQQKAPKKKQKIDLRSARGGAGYDSYGDEYGSEGEYGNEVEIEQEDGGTEAKLIDGLWYEYLN